MFACPWVSTAILPVPYQQIVYCLRAAADPRVEEICVHLWGVWLLYKANEIQHAMLLGCMRSSRLLMQVTQTFLSFVRVVMHHHA